MTLDELCAEYAPYDRMVEFKEGFVDYQIGIDHKYYSGTKAQAYDRGRECAMRWAKEQALDAYCEQQPRET